MDHTDAVARWLSCRASDLWSSNRVFEPTLLRNNLRQVVHTLLPLSPSSIIWYQRKLVSKQAYRVVHQPVSCGFAVFADAWLSGWLAEISADLRENGSALEVVLHDYALYKSTFTLLYFTLPAITPMHTQPDTPNFVNATNPFRIPTNGLSRPMSNFCLPGTYTTRTKADFDLMWRVRVMGWVSFYQAFYRRGTAYEKEMSTSPTLL